MSFTDDQAKCTTSGEPVDKVLAEQTSATGQHKSYVVLCPAERAKGFVRPVRASYRHAKCGTVTTMAQSIAETFARDPSFYGSGFCCRCNAHFPNAELTWTEDGEVVGS